MSKSWLAWALAAGALSTTAVVACSSSSSDSAASMGGAAGSGGTDAGTGGSYVDSGGTAGNAGTAGTGGTGGAAGEAGDAGDAGGETFLARACTSDTDCDTGFCLLPDGNDFYDIAGPSGGYCTLDCTAYATDATQPNPCAALSPLSSCVPIAQTSSAITRAVCFEGCALGAPAVTQINNQLDDTKCHGRRDMACVQPTDDNYGAVGMPYCEPMCQRDADCSAAQRKCDPRLKLCVDEANLTPGAPFGSSCSEWAQSDGGAGVACAGVCLGLRKTVEAGASDPANLAYFCSERCVFNTVDGCGFQETPPGGVCLIAGSNDGSGDEAYCMQMCDVDSDCKAYGDSQANVYCDLIGVQNNWGRGFCYFHYGEAEAGAYPCADGELNGTETDVDCGGLGCSRCINGKACTMDSDCVSNHCADPGDGGALVCAP